MSSRPSAEHPSRLVHAAILGLLLLPSLLVQLAIPGWASAFAATTPEVEYLVIPYSAAAILFIACGQVALLAAWRLLWLSGGGLPRTRVGVRWVDVIIACAVAATMLAIVVLVHMLRFVPGGGGPTVYFIGPTVIGGVIATALLIRRRRRLVLALHRRDGAPQPPNTDAALPHR